MQFKCEDILVDSVAFIIFKLFCIVNIAVNNTYFVYLLPNIEFFEVVGRKTVKIKHKIKRFKVNNRFFNYNCRPKTKKQKAKITTKLKIHIHIKHFLFHIFYTIKCACVRAR